MDFSFSDEQQMLQESVQKFVHRHYAFDARRAILASAAGYSAEHWALFAELGWLTVPFSEADGGFGGLATDLMVLMEEFGKALVVEPFVSSWAAGLSVRWAARRKKSTCCRSSWLAVCSWHARFTKNRAATTSRVWRRRRMFLAAISW